MKVVVSGYFDPIHAGHLQLIREAAEYGEVTIILNSDEQATLKKKKAFMPLGERLEICKNIKSVENVVVSFDQDTTVRRTLAYVKPDIFFKGGDSNQDNVPEEEVCEQLGIKLMFGTQYKVESSSCLIKNSK